MKIIRKEMIKCRDSKLRPTSVDFVAEHLQEQITGVIDILDELMVNTPDKVWDWSKRNRYIYWEFLDFELGIDS